MTPYPPPIWQQIAQLAIPLTIGAGFGWVCSRFGPITLYVFSGGILIELGWMIVSAERSRRELNRQIDQLVKDSQP